MSQEWKLEYHIPPWGNGPRSPHIVIIEAPTKDDAESVLRDHITRSGKCDGKYADILSCKPYESPRVGRVVSFG